MKKLFLPLCFVLVLPIRFVLAQQDYHFSHFMYTNAIINPGAAGSTEMINLGLINRQQWTSMPGGPTTTLFTVDAPFKLGKIKNGGGIHLVQDKIADLENIHLKGTYAYRRDLGDGRLGIGVSLGLLNKGFNAAQYYGYINGSVEEVDLTLDQESKQGFDVAGGIFYKTDELYFGISATHLYPLKFEWTEDKVSLKSRMHLYITGGYKYELKNPSFELQPSMMVYSDGISIPSAILNATLLYNNKMYFGVSYRVRSSIVGMIGMELFEDVQVGYSYDFGTSDLAQYYRSSHELMIRYSFSLNIDKDPKNYKSIRFL